MQRLARPDHSQKVQDAMSVGKFGRSYRVAWLVGRPLCVVELVHLGVVGGGCAGAPGLSLRRLRSNTVQTGAHSKGATSDFAGIRCCW